MPVTPQKHQEPTLPECSPEGAAQLSRAQLWVTSNVTLSPGGTAEFA